MSEATSQENGAPEPGARPPLSPIEMAGLRVAAQSAIRRGQPRMEKCTNDKAPHDKCTHDPGSRLPERKQCWQQVEYTPPVDGFTRSSPEILALLDEVESLRAAQGDIRESTRSALAALAGVGTYRCPNPHCTLPISDSRYACHCVLSELRTILAALPEVDPRPADLAIQCAENEHDCDGTAEYGCASSPGPELVLCACRCHAVTDEMVEQVAQAIRRLEREHGVDGKDWTGLDSDLVARTAILATITATQM